MEILEKVSEYVDECEQTELVTFNGELKVYIKDLPYPFNYMSIDEFYNEYLIEDNEREEYSWDSV